MLMEVLLFSVTIIALIIASYSDLGSREVPDWLNYSLIFAALGIRGIFSVEGGWTILLSGLLGLGVCFGLASLFYYSDQWGGGDSKLLMGMGAVIGISYPFSLESLNLLWFFLALLLLGALYGLFWVLGLALLHRRTFGEGFRNLLYSYKNVHLLLGVFSLVVFLLFVFWLKGYSFLWPLVPFPLAAFYLFLFVTAVENHCFLRKVPIGALTEGDWLGEDVVIEAKVALKKRTLEKSDLEHLRKLHKEGKLEKVLIREGIPFVPSFLLAYVLVTFGLGVVWAVLNGILG